MFNLLLRKQKQVKTKRRVLNNIIYCDTTISLRTNFQDHQISKLVLFALEIFGPKKNPKIKFV